MLRLRTAHVVRLLVALLLAIALVGSLAIGFANAQGSSGSLGSSSPAPGPGPGPGPDPDPALVFEGTPSALDVTPLPGTVIVDGGNASIAGQTVRLAAGVAAPQAGGHLMVNGSALSPSSAFGVVVSSTQTPSGETIIQLGEASLADAFSEYFVDSTVVIAQPNPMARQSTEKKKPPLYCSAGTDVNKIDWSIDNVEISHTVRGNLLSGDVESFISTSLDAELALKNAITTECAFNLLSLPQARAIVTVIEGTGIVSEVRLDAGLAVKASAQGRVWGGNIAADLGAAAEDFVPRPIADLRFRQEFTANELEVESKVFLRPSVKSPIVDLSAEAAIAHTLHIQPQTCHVVSGHAGAKAKFAFAKWGIKTPLEDLGADTEYEFFSNCTGEPTTPAWVPVSHFSSMPFRSSTQGCALATGGRVFCLGAPDDSTMPSELRGLNLLAGEPGVSGEDGFVQVRGLSGPAVDVVAAEDRACAVLGSGAVECWPGVERENDPNRWTDFRFAPRAVPGLPGPAKEIISMGFEDELCVLLRAGGAYCGYDEGPMVPYFEPLPTSGMNKVSISADRWCALMNDASVQCKDAPIGVRNLPGTYRDVEAAWDHFCVVESAGDLYCWGSNRNGVGTLPTEASEPTYIMSGVKEVSLSDRGTCALTSGGEFFCWGDTAFTTGGQQPQKVDLGGRKAIRMERVDHPGSASARSVRCLVFSDNAPYCHTGFGWEQVVIPEPR